MAFIPIPNCVKVAMEFVVAGQPVVLTFGVCKGSPINTGDLSNVGVAFNSWWEANIRPFQTTNVQLLGTRATDQTTQFSPEVFTTKTTNNFGAATDPILPNNVAIAVQQLTNLRGRAHRGTSYMFGFGHNRLADSDHITPAFQTTLLTAYSQIEPTLAPAGFNQVVLSRTLNGAPRITGVGTDVVGYSANTILDDMGRRLK